MKYAVREVMRLAALSGRDCTEAQAEQALASACRQVGVLLEACVPNQDGKGHHDSKTGHPCKVSSSSSSTSRAGGGQHKGSSGRRSTSRAGGGTGKPARRRKPKTRRQSGHATATPAHARPAPEAATQQRVTMPIQQIGHRTAQLFARRLSITDGVEQAQFIPGSEPPDNVLVIDGRIHGLEIKTFVSTRKRPLSVKMGRRTRLDKEDWEEDNDATMHTLMVNHTHRWASASEDERRTLSDTLTDEHLFPCYYRRGGSNGPATDPPAIKIRTPAELVQVLRMSDDELEQAFGGRGVRPLRLIGSPDEQAIRSRQTKR